MHNKPSWLSLIATVLNGSGLITARPLSMRGRAWSTLQHAHMPARRSLDIRLNGAKPTELWSSVVTRTIHRVEEFTMLLIMAHFAIGALGVLFDW